MIHHQQRRDLAATQPATQPATHPATAAAPAAQEPGTVDADVYDAAAPVVPRQERRPTRDAYDLYAQIYAIRTEDHTS